MENSNLINQNIQDFIDVDSWSKDKNDRQKAIKWWDDLPESIINQDFFERYFVKTGKFTPAKDWTELTGREIEQIWLDQNKEKCQNH